MDNFKPDYIKKQEQSKVDKERSMWVLSYNLKGMAAGIFAIALFCYVYIGDYPAKYLIGGGLLGYFVGGLLGKFFYTKPQ
ncbi:hypothetical protein KKH39_00090 [Patescibacteria group bacterium]|nr:hypothetical protein [Patescibacteria group bacterium]